ncbi:MAG: hypothetical protein AB8H03_04160 [Saprospiraceae bacterium]
MKSQIINLIAVIILMVFFNSCDSGPKVIEAENTNNDYPSSPIVKEISNTPKSNSSTTGETYEVVVKEVLNTDKYSYLQVDKKGESIWIAIAKTDVEEGETYFYRGGLLKKDFFSREFNRVFETLYLVSNFWKKNKEDVANEKENKLNIPAGHSLPDLVVEKINPAEGAISLEELFSNKPMYNDTNVKITGKCVKVNPRIMNRNWLHIQDGSGNGLDLTVTTQEEVALGAIVSLEGTITVDKDFGAGYRYEIIMEKAVVK